MFRATARLGLAATIVMATAMARADELKSGLAVGDSVGPFDVVKAAGADNDNVKIGETLCYR
jgi:hypothetical protein